MNGLSPMLVEQTYGTQSFRTIQPLLMWVGNAVVLSFWTAVLLTGSNSVVQAANNSRSDSVDVLHTTIHLDVTDFSGQTIRGMATICFVAKVDSLMRLDLDLLQLTIDSVRGPNGLLTYLYPGQQTIQIYLPQPMMQGDTSEVTVYYQGKPKKDSGGWGGWYWSGDLAFNIGVALTDVPHTFGRAWFPCFDNFVERCTYTLYVRTPADKVAVCGGALVGYTPNADGTTTWHWELTQPVPSYLISVAVHKYALVHDNYISVTGDTIPILLGALASDTLKLKNSFKHLKDALAMYEAAWGPYRWQKVGYVLTTVGAMEHATNVAYPNFLVNGLTTYEQIMAHELSHHWFGNLATCRADSEMWINEGWAVFNEFLFFEKKYGAWRARQEVEATLERCVRYLHTPLSDGQYFSLHSIPSTHTYGETVYKKGALVAHTLRAQLGDSLFFSCLRQWLDAFAFRDVSSKDMETFLSQCAQQDLSHFFSHWVYNPGWPAFWIDSVQVEPAPIPGFLAHVFIRQKVRGAPKLFEQVSLPITFWFADGSRQDHWVTMSGACQWFTFFLSHQPVFTALDPDVRIADAVLGEQKTISATGPNNFALAKMNLNVLSLTDSCVVRIEHVYAAPDPLKNPPPGLHISRERFWIVDGIFSDNWLASATIQYNGTSTSGGFLDNQLLGSTSEDSLVVLYRSSPAHDWTVVTDAVHNPLGSSNDKKGFFTLPQLRKGQYTFGIQDINRVDSIVATPDSCLLLALQQAASKPGILKLMPNPAHQQLTIKTEGAGLLRIFDIWGRMQRSLACVAGTFTLNVRDLPAGLYLFVYTSLSGGNAYQLQIIQ